MTVEPRANCKLMRLCHARALPPLSSPALVFSTLLLPQTADLLTAWSARASAHPQQLTEIHRRLLSMQRIRAPFSNLITRLLVPYLVNLHGSLPTFSSLFLLQSERTDKLSGTQDLIVNGWPAAQEFPHCHTTVSGHTA